VLLDHPVAWLGNKVELAAEPVFELGGISIDPVSREATFGGQRERLQPQNLKVLILLARRKGQVVTRDDIVECCWGARFVGDDVINRSISTLRQFAKRAGGFDIETFPRAGYRLTETQAKATRIKQWRPMIAAAAALLIAVTGWYLQRSRGVDKADSAPTIAVMPFVEGSPGRDVHELAAAARTSLSDALTEGGYPVRLIEQRSADRQPDLLVSGEIRHTGSSVQALVQVQETRHGAIVYSQHFEAKEESASGLADQIGASVTTNLLWAATLMMLDRRHPSDPAITAQLLNAESMAGDGRDSLRAYEMARQIAPQAPDSAVAQYSLASETENVFGDLPRDQRAAAVIAGRQAADRLLTLAPDFGEAHVLWCGLHPSILIGQCEDHARKGLSVDPDAPLLSDGLSGLLNAVGRVNEALQLSQIALAKDPFNPVKLGRMIRIMEEEGYKADAERLFRQSIRWWPDHRVIYWSRLVGIEARGDYSELERFAREVDGDKLPLDRDAAVKIIAAARAHDRGGAIRACPADGLRWTNQYLCVTALADLGELDASFAIARKLFSSARGRDAADEERIWLDEPGGFSIAMLSSPAAASLRRDPRFLELADGAGLLAYWRSGRLPDFCRSKPEAVCASILRTHGQMS
jgi:DNA-binding winged helix-turn-helix (wHTH) protein/tetratricopeptide (TPR) repeat protein